MPIRYPQPLRPGDRVGVTSPSSGVAKDMQERLKVAIGVIEARGYEVVVGDCMDGAPSSGRSHSHVMPKLRAGLNPKGGEGIVHRKAGQAAEPGTQLGFSREYAARSL
jgi:muramoyltetrapeptide carboxypeptidase